MTLEALTKNFSPQIKSNLELRVACVKQSVLGLGLRLPSNPSYFHKPIGGGYMWSEHKASMQVVLLVLLKIVKYFYPVLQKPVKTCASPFLALSHPIP